MDKVAEECWDPCTLLLNPEANYKYAVIVLNTPINISIGTKQILNLWKNGILNLSEYADVNEMILALVRITVDGGTDRWLTWLKLSSENNHSNLYPDLITGDMDSIEPTTLEFYKNKGAKVVVTEDQNETDFTKAVGELKKFSGEHNLNIDYILVINNNSGRFDQIIANVNTLYKINATWASVKVFLISDCISWLLGIGNHRIKIPGSLCNSQEWCALIPIGKKAIVSTIGLKWNLDHSPLEFGHMVSTSNTYVDTEVSVVTDTAIIWSMGIENLICKKCERHNE